MRPNLFTLLNLIVFLFSVVIGARTGFTWLGLPGGVIGSVVGGVSSVMIGRLTSAAMDRATERHYRKKSIDSLRANLDDGYTSSTYVSCLIVSILLERNESVESLRDYVFRQLHSCDACQRRSGLVSLGLCYPVLAEQLKGFNVFDPTKDDLERLARIETLCYL